MSYLWDDQLRLFRRLGMPAFEYSDGPGVEARLLSIVRETRDVSTFSPELAQRITDWPSEYHFSRLRHCLLRPLNITSGRRVLELGAGCGAITRFLGETGADVTAVEGSVARARVASERCRDLSNVRVVVDDLMKFESDDRYDYVLLIGVLEYAAVFSSSANPFQECLRSAANFLAPGGEAVVAIENKVGLKYFNGCGEDHLGTPFAGIQGLYGDRTARTFGRQELRAELTSAGLSQSYFYYPFPDYKLPSVILSEDAFRTPGFKAIDLVARCHARDYDGSPYRSFDDALGFDSLYRNGLLADLSNSFLVVAAPEGASNTGSSTLAFAFSVNRAPEFITGTTFFPKADEIRVAKERLASKASCVSLIAQGFTFTHSLLEEPYVPGRQIIWDILKARAQSDSMESLARAFQPWLEFLLTKAIETPALDVGKKEPRQLSTLHLPGEYLDCTPFNLLRHENRLLAIDKEWNCDSAFSLGWVVTRGVLWSLPAGVPDEQPSWSFVDLVIGLCRDQGLTVTKEEIAGWLAAEEELQALIVGAPCSGITAPVLSGGYIRFSKIVPKLQQEILKREQLNRKLGTLEVEVRSTSETVQSLRKAISKQRAIERDQNTRIQQLCDESLAREATVQQLAEDAREAQTNLSAVRSRLASIESSAVWRALSRLRDRLNNYPGLRRAMAGTVRWTWWTASFQLPRRLRNAARLKRHCRTIAASGLFDASWYAKRYPDVALSGMDPVTHYVLHGGKEWRNPGPGFDANWYAHHYSDVANSDVNPLLHYLVFGISEGRHCRAVAAEVEEVPIPSDQPTTTGCSEAQDSAASYQRWIEQYDTLSASDLDAIRNHLTTLEETPLISVVMPVFNPEPTFLRQALESVLSQLYSKWELCIADDASTDPAIPAILQEFSDRDSRIKTVRRQKNGHIAAASNSALELANGEYVALVDHDDVLPPHALYMVALEILEHPGADIIYSDEDYVDESGMRQNPHFKPDWNQELFYSQNYINHLCVYRAPLIKDLGGFRQGYDGSQDYDLALRVVAKSSPDRIRHIPHILYHWRWAGSVKTFATSNLPTAVQAAHRALKDYFSSKGTKVEVDLGCTTCFNRVYREVPVPAPRVSAVIPTRDRGDLLKACIDGLLSRTDYENLELIIVDNGTEEPATVRYLLDVEKSERVTVLRVDAPFNHSTLSNLGVEHATGELILFLNNDIEVIEPGWLKEMVAQLSQPGVGAVGAKLYYRNDTIQHAGVVLGVGGTAGHGQRHTWRGDGGYACRLQLVQNVSCATAACLLMPKRVFEEVGRFDEQGFAISYNDVDLCLRIGRAGYKIVWTPYAELYHIEAVSRGYDYEARNWERALSEVRELRKRWGAILTHDPMYSPNLTLRDESFGFAFPPRSLKPWLSWKGQDAQAHDRVARVVSPSTLSRVEFESSSSTITASAGLPRSIAIGVSGLGNFFMTEIANMLRSAFVELGVEARVFSELEASDVAADDAVLIVAPHEFFLLGEGPEAHQILRRHSNLFLLNTEQLQTSWFNIAQEYFKEAAAVLDINHQSAQEICRQGIRAATLPIGYSEYIVRKFDTEDLPDHRLFDSMPAEIKRALPKSYAERPIDILFVGTSSPRRSGFFARNAGYFAGKNAFIYLPGGMKPFLPDDPRGIDFATFIALSRRSKILLNVHRDNVPYLESQRIVTFGTMQKTLVITETSESLPHLLPDLDYLQGGLDSLTSLCEFALRNPDSISALVDRSYESLKRNWSMRDIVADCWRNLAVQNHRSEPLGRPVGAGHHHDY